MGPVVMRGSACFPGNSWGSRILRCLVQRTAWAGLGKRMHARGPRTVLSAATNLNDELSVLSDINYTMYCRQKVNDVLSVRT